MRKLGSVREKKFHFYACLTRLDYSGCAFLLLGKAALTGGWGWPGAGAAPEAGLRTVFIDLVGGPGWGCGEAERAWARALGLNLRWTLELQYLAAQTTPWTHSISIAGGGPRRQYF